MVFASFISSFFYMLLYIGQAEDIALYTEKKIEEIQNGAVAKSYMTNSLLIHG
jgi:hypothetical protein